MTARFGQNAGTSESKRAELSDVVGKGEQLNLTDPWRVQIRTNPRQWFVPLPALALETALGNLLSTDIDGRRNHVGDLLNRLIEDDFLETAQQPSPTPVAPTDSDGQRKR